jgi:hypothetical protein
MSELTECRLTDSLTHGLTDNYQLPDYRSAPQRDVGIAPSPVREQRRATWASQSLRLLRAGHVGLLGAALVGL